MAIPINFNKPEASFWETMQWEPSPTQVEQFVTLQKLLNHFNKKVNLTRLLIGKDYWVSQVCDSLWPLQKELNAPKKPINCIDVGTGCGFPGLAVAIALPKASLTLVDATRKKTKALDEITTQLGLNSRITILTERIETTGQNNTFRGMYDLAMARAVADAPITAEYLIPLLKLNGEALLYRGRWIQKDQENLLKALVKLKASLKKVQSFNLPYQQGLRHVIHLEAKLPCPRIYPRSIGIPKKNPLSTHAIDNLC